MAACKVPKVRGTAVAASALDVGEAWALPSIWVTVTLVGGRTLPGICAQQITGAAYRPTKIDISVRRSPKQPSPTQTIPLALPDTHGDSSAGQPAHGSQVCSGRNVAPLSGVNSAGTAPCVGHRPQDPWGRCFHCIRMAGTGLQASMGHQSAQGHKHHTAVLPTIKGKTISVQASYLTPIPYLPAALGLTCVPSLAVAPDLLGVPITVARSSKVPLASRAFRARTGPALAPIGEPGIPVEASHAPAVRRKKSCVCNL